MRIATTMRKRRMRMTWKSGTTKRKVVRRRLQRWE